LTFVKMSPGTPPPARGRERSRYVSDAESLSEDEEDGPDFKNYQPPLRLVVFEVTALILLICLIIPEPLGISAISGTGDTTIGLLRGSPPFTDCYQLPLT
jgi:hypothetical protein